MNRDDATSCLEVTSLCPAAPAIEVALAGCSCAPTSGSCSWRGPVLQLSYRPCLAKSQGSLKLRCGREQFHAHDAKVVLDAFSASYLVVWIFSSSPGNFQLLLPLVVIKDSRCTIEPQVLAEWPMAPGPIRPNICRGIRYLAAFWWWEGKKPSCGQLSYWHILCAVWRF